LATVHNKQQTGRWGENKALDFLIQCGYELLASNYRVRRAEFDLLMKDGNELVVVEVKTRYNALLEPEKSVSKNQQKILIQGVEEYLKMHPQYKTVRFDIVAINLHAGKMNLTHFKDAFYPSY
jgi:putative endonuclease